MKYLNRLILTIILISSFALPQAALAAGLVASKAKIVLPKGDSITMPGYLVLENNTDEEVILIKIRSRAFSLAMIHQTANDRGNVRMLLKSELVLKPKSKMILSKKDVHLMFAGPKIKLKRGKKVKVTLYFNSGEKLTAEFNLVR